MNIRSAAILASCAAVAMPAAAAPPKAKEKPEILYALANTYVAVSATMKLVGCPSAEGDELEIEIDWQVAATAAADWAKPVRIEVSTGFLAKRANAFEFYPNGTLAGYNGSSEGQGGPFLGSVLRTVGKLAGAFAAVPMAASGGRPVQTLVANRLYCRTGVSKLLTTLAATRSEIRELENKVLAQTATSAELDLLDRRRKNRIALTDALTLKKTVQFPQDEGKPWTARLVVPELLDDWFSSNPEDAADGAGSFEKNKLVGIDGFDVEVVRASAASSEPTSGLTEIPRNAQRSLLYRRPVPANVTVSDVGCGAAAKCKVTLDDVVPIGQWGAIRSVPVGSAGLFGKREAAASFDAFGTPIKLSYGSDSGAADIGTTIETAGDTLVSAADADVVALERAIKREELRQKLRDLRATDVDPGP